MMRSSTLVAYGVRWSASHYNEGVTTATFVRNKVTIENLPLNRQVSACLTWQLSFINYYDFVFGA